MIASVDAEDPVTSPLPLLTGYDAKRCQRRVHNDHDATLDTVPWEVPPDLQQRFDAGKAFEADVFAALVAAVDPVRRRDLSALSGKQRLIDATVAAMDDGVELILGGWLPDDESGGRTGRPDLLLRVGDGYVPGDVKWHKTVRTAKSGKLRYSLPSAPGDVREADGLAARTTERIDDFLQLAHYWRMLEAIGRSASEGGAWGFIIGTDQLVAARSGRAHADLAPARHPAVHDLLALAGDGEAHRPGALRLRARHPPRDRPGRREPHGCAGRPRAAGRPDLQPGVPLLPVARLLPRARR